jgi:hypothetical protein
MMNKLMERDRMKAKEKFLRFVGVWFTYLIVSIPLLKWVVVPELGPGLGDASVVVNVVLMLLVWGIAFFNWGPIRGNWSA